MNNPSANPRDTEADVRQQLDQLVAAFFRCFSPDASGRVDVAAIRGLFIDRALIVRNSDAAPEIYGLDSFIAPRERLLNDGTLTGFSEQELSAHTDIFGRIAQRFSLYRKRGVQAGVAFETLGMKTIQFIDTADGWRICALAWDDERAGLKVPASLLPADDRA